MHRELLLVTASLGVTGCVLDRTGQSASEIYRRELALQGARVTNVEGQFDNLEARVAQLEELSRARGQEEILKMETLDQVRQELANVRGEVEVLRHDYDQTSLDSYARDEDAQFRIRWMEMRADQLEKSLGLKPPPPPEPLVASAVEGGTDSGEPAVDTAQQTPPDEGGDDASVTDPDAMIKLAEEHLAAGREKAAIAVLDRFLTAYPDNKRVPEAMYRRAEGYFNQGNYAAAVLKFQEVIDKDKNSAWAAWAMLRQGECFDEQGQGDNARLFYEDVLRMWPKSRAAKEARQKLGK